MSTYPSSTCTTNGSANDFPPLPAVQSLIRDNSASSTPSSSTSALAAQRIAAYLSNPVDSQPLYQYTDTATSFAAHTKDMKTYLERFDEATDKTG